MGKELGTGKEGRRELDRVNEGSWRDEKARRMEGQERRGGMEVPGCRRDST